MPILFSSAALALALASAAPPGDPADVEAFVRVLHAVELGADEDQRAACARELAALPGVVELHLATTSAGHLPATASAEAQPLLAEHWALLERAADLLRRDDVVGVVTLGLEQGRAEDWRAAALDLLGRSGAASDLRLLVRLAGDAQHGDAALVAFESAAGRLFRRAPEALEALEDLSLIPEPATLALIDVVGVACGPAGVPWLLRQLADEDHADRALQSLARVAPAVPLDEAPELAGTLRPWLDSGSPLLRRQAMRALTGLQDETSIPRLVELLVSVETGEARAAARALGELTGRRLPADATAWSGWLARELEWWGARSEPALAALWSEDAGEALAAVAEVSARGLLRDRLSLELARVLREHPLPEVREKACLGLSRLRSRAACTELVLTLETTDDSIGVLAWRALQSITGLSHPADPRAWRSALALSR